MIFVHDVKTLFNYNIVYKILIVFLLILADIFSKYYVFKLIDLNNFIELAYFLDLTHIHNFGISFGLFSGKVHPWIFILLGILITILIFLMMMKSEKTIERWGFTIIISGAISNIIDRSINGYVIDFIYIHYNEFYWPAFNFADIYITVGILLILFQMLIDLSIRLSK